MKRVTVKLGLNGIEKEITTNNSSDLYAYFDAGYTPISVKFVPGGEELIEPIPKRNEVSITDEYIISAIKASKLSGCAELNAKLVKRNDPKLLKWYVKFPCFDDRLPEEEKTEGKMQLEFEKLNKDYRK